MSNTTILLPFFLQTPLPLKLGFHSKWSIFLTALHIPAFAGALALTWSALRLCLPTSNPLFFWSVAQFEDWWTDMNSYSWVNRNIFKWRSRIHINIFTDGILDSSSNLGSILELEMGSTCFCNPCSRGIKWVVSGKENALVPPVTTITEHTDPHFTDKEPEA